MKRFILVLLLLVIGAAGLYYFNQLWMHRYDLFIRRQANVYRLDPDLVWSVIYEETYFRPWKIGGDGEIGLMQVTPTVGREWAAQTGMPELERRMTRDPQTLLRDPERNIGVGCWYLEKLYEDFRDVPGVEARMVAGYNAGPSRATEWSRTKGTRPLTEAEFVARIDIPSTRAYVTDILERYHKLKDARRAAAGNEAGSNRNIRADNERTAAALEQAR